MSHTRLRRWMALAPLFLTVVACDGEAGGGAAHVVRDSAGIRIVDNFAPAWREGEEWRVHPNPEVTIGVIDGERQYMFISVAGAVRYSDRRIAVLDEGASELRMYDHAGNFVAMAGGTGSGPGEFPVQPRQLVRTQADTLLVLVRREIQRFDPDLQFIDSSSPDPRSAGAALPSGWETEGITSVMSDDGRIYQAYGGAVQSYVGVAADGQPFMLEDFPSESSQTFPRQSFLAVGGIPPRIATGYSEEYDFAIFDANGELLHRIRDDLPRDRVTSEDLERRRRQLSESAPSQEIETLWLQQFDEAVHPEMHPAFASLFIDQDAHVWVRRRSGKAEWSVYDPDGIYLGQVGLPSDLIRVFDIGRDYVLGLFLADAFGTQQIRLYRLERGA